MEARKLIEILKRNPGSTTGDIATAMEGHHKDRRRQITKWLAELKKLESAGVIMSGWDSKQRLMVWSAA